MAPRDVKNIRSMSGWGYAGVPGSARLRNFGHIESLSRTIDVTTEPVWTSGTGVRVKSDTRSAADTIRSAQELIDARARADAAAKTAAARLAAARDLCLDTAIPEGLLDE